MEDIKWSNIYYSSSVVNHENIILDIVSDIFKFQKYAFVSMLGINCLDVKRSLNKLWVIYFRVEFIY